MTCIGLPVGFRTSLTTMAIHKAAILYELRDEILEELSSLCGVPQQGVAQAARACKAAGSLSRPMCNLLVNFDFTYNMVRHLTSMKARKFRSDLCENLQACAKLQAKAGCKVTICKEMCGLSSPAAVPAAPHVPTTPLVPPAEASFGPTRRSFSDWVAPSQATQAAELDKKEKETTPLVPTAAAPRQATSGPLHAVLPTEKRREQQAAEGHKEKKDTTPLDLPAAAPKATRFGHRETVYYSQVLQAAELDKKKKKTTPLVPTAAAPVKPKAALRTRCSPLADRGSSRPQRPTRRRKTLHRWSYLPRPPVKPLAALRRESRSLC